MVYLHSIKLENFKGFKEEEILFKTPDDENKGSGLNIFVGENNTGKSTLIEAIEFLKNGTKKDINLLSAHQRHSRISPLL